MTNNKYFFIGIGGIGMSSIAQYLYEKENTILGYDASENKSVKILEKKGIEVTNKLSLKSIPDYMKNDDVIVVYTPAIPDDNIFLKYFRANGNKKIQKRSEILGEISKQSKCIAIAGTHGKTTTTAIISHLFHSSGIHFKAFIGGIMKCFDSNYINTGNDFILVEADEYDRSFLNLNPNYAVITSIESDHLDIYGDYKSLSESFQLFRNNVKDVLITDAEIDIDKDFSFSIKSDSDYRVNNIKILENGIRFDLKTPNNFYSNISTNIIGLHNLKNVLAALSIIDQIEEIDIQNLLPFLSNFKGIERRMDIYKLDNKVIIDDYAHHPTEIESVLNTIQTNFKNKSKAVVFQPHLFSRTRDFMDEFAIVLSKFDEVYLLDIYPARENPIIGVNSQILLEKINCSKKKIIDGKSIEKIVLNSKMEVISILGAGNISENLNKEIFQNV
ncbi:UDP-N-acetylmuramate--L-alanine ligase [Flavobacteriaceae bacterium]|nr:UDP-N-acetylmuramate--L-alanine ligase [Flavobacteriaceae bacterium]